MLKHHTLICSGLAAAFAAPALVGQEGDLTTRLASTLKSLEELELLQPSVASGETHAIARLLSIGGESLPATPERDERLVAARADVAELAAQLDELTAAEMTQLTSDPSREDLDGSRRVRAAAGSTAKTDRQRFEDPGYSADAIREARLLVRAERFADANTVLGALEASEEVTYLKARCAAGLGDDAAAMVLFRELAQSESGSEFVRWAKQEVRMGELRQRIEATRKQGGQQ